MLENTNVKEISQAVLILRELNADEKMRYLADMREKALHDEATAINAAEKKGREEGIAVGAANERKLIIEKLKASGMSDEQIQTILNLS